MIRSRFAGRVAVSGLVVASSIVVPISAWATPVLTASGFVDRSCVHQVPKGASVDVQSGDVLLNGVVVQHYDLCNNAQTGVGPLAPASTSGAPQGASPGGWYQTVAANAQLLNGMKQFDALEVSFTVPPAPNVPKTDTAVWFLFPGLDNLATPGNPGTAGSIIQPVLQRGALEPDVGGGGEYYQIYPEFNGYGDVWFNGVELVNPGDNLEGVVIQTANNLDAWQIAIYDLTSGAYSSFQVINIPNSWPKYNWAAMGALEGYGNIEQTDGLNECSELPSSNNEYFTVDYVQQAGPYWNSWNNVTPSWGRLEFVYSPNCSWTAWFDSTQCQLQWTN